jgi:O-acetyl-ADP-ribose deacetylase (regulator of RNase III)
MPILHFVDLNKTFVQAFSKEFRGVPNIKTSVGRVEDLKAKHLAFVSPANSFGYMDGGIDRVYSREMFPGVEAKVKETIASLGLVRESLDRPYLPVGSCFLIEGAPSRFLIIAPTMLLPRDIRGTKNVFWAMYGILNLLKKLESKVSLAEVICPALGGGIGMVPPEEIARQCKLAYDLFSRSLASAPKDTSSVFWLYLSSIRTDY